MRVPRQAFCAITHRRQAPPVLQVIFVDLRERNTTMTMNTQRPPPITAVQEAIACLPPVSRHEQLRLELLNTVDSLQRRRADLVSEDFIEDYVALHWLEWNGGALRLTVTGTNMCAQIRARLN